MHSGLHGRHAVDGEHRLLVVLLDLHLGVVLLHESEHPREQFRLVERRVDRRGEKGH